MKIFKTENGKCKVRLNSLKIIVYITVLETKNLNGFLDEIKAQFSDKTVCFRLLNEQDLPYKKVFTVDSYEINKTFESDENFKLQLLKTDEDIKLYLTITNEAIKDSDILAPDDLKYIKRILKDKGTDVGLILYKDQTVGTYCLFNSDLDSFVIDKRYQGQSLSYGALKAIVNLCNGHLDMAVSSNNKIALHVYKKLGFKKSKRISTYYLLK